jgi:DNA-binding phage protein
LKDCAASEREALESQQQALKILANATSYGIFVEINVEELTKPLSALRYSDDGTPSKVSVDKAELPGSYFHPLLASLITAAARLMLGITEQLATDAGLDWAFCDTDSMAFAKPADMEDAEFHRRVADIRTWFNVLNPYEGAGDLLKLEDANFELVDGRASSTLAPLYVWAISAKRYALFNLDATERPVLRKASAHGLGHLMPPYSEAAAPPSISVPVVPLKSIGVDRWQYDVWYRIVKAALNGCPDQPNLSDLPGFDQPAASRYGATTPSLLRWYDAYNDGEDYRDQVRPFNFLTVFPARRPRASDLAEFSDEPGSCRQRLRDRADLPRPVAPYNLDPARAAENCFDRLTGEPVPANRLKTCAEALADYHLRPETKFLNGDYIDRGPTVRRHIHIAGVRYIGKEANRWEEQFYLGLDPETQIEYGIDEDSGEQFPARLRQAVKLYGERNLARTAGVAREQLRAVRKGEAKPRPKTMAKLLRAISLLAAQVHGHRSLCRTLNRGDDETE